MFLFGLSRDLTDEEVNHLKGLEQNKTKYGSLSNDAIRKEENLKEMNELVRMIGDLSAEDFSKNMIAECKKKDSGITRSDGGFALAKSL